MGEAKDPIASLEEALDYEKLLERLYSKLPRRAASAERFEPPVAEVIHVGSQTIVRNFREIADKLRRDERLVMRFLLKELAVAGSVDPSGALVLNARMSSRVINNLLNLFVRDYVICPTCGRPDTRIERRGKVWMLLCEACGAEQPLKPF